MRVRRLLLFPSLILRVPQRNDEVIHANWKWLRSHSLIYYVVTSCRRKKPSTYNIPLLPKNIERYRTKDFSWNFGVSPWRHLLRFHDSVSSENHFTVNPREHHISVIISLDCSESEDAKSAYEDSCLREILAGYPALDATMND